jgi:hypothetical protein
MEHGNLNCPFIVYIKGINKMKDYLNVARIIVTQINTVPRKVPTPVYKYN